MVSRGASGPLGSTRPLSASGLIRALRRPCVRAASALIVAAKRPPRELFLGYHYLRHNQRRQEHLATLGLPIHGKRVLEVGAGIGDHTSFFLDRGCSVIVTEPRSENLAVLRARYPELPVIQLDLDIASPARERDVDIVYCYGVLYHLSHPAEAIAYMASRTSGMLLLESCVAYGDEDALNPVGEAEDNPTQAVAGRGCRPTRRWVRDRLARHFPHVYATVTQPNHPEFPVDWTTAQTDGGLTRAIFVASRDPIPNELLTETLPLSQRRAP